MPGASRGILYYPGLVSCSFYAIPIIITFLIYEMFHLLVYYDFSTAVISDSLLFNYNSY